MAIHSMSAIITSSLVTKISASNYTLENEAKMRRAGCRELEATDSGNAAMGGSMILE